MVARNRMPPNFYDDTPSEPSAPSRAETPRITRIGSHGATADDDNCLYRLCDLIGGWLVLAAGAYTVGSFFALGCRHVWGM